MKNLKKCKTCSKEFVIASNRINKAKYCSHKCYFKGRNYKRTWTSELCSEDAKKYTTTKEWIEKSPNAYVAACRHGWLTECQKHMQRLVMPAGTWSKKTTCHKEALKYNKRRDFKTYGRGAYDAARKKGWLEDICTHMQVFTKSGVIREPNILKLEFIDITHHPCFIAGTEIYTDKGIKNIEELKIGDKILNSVGNFSMIKNVIRREHSGKVYGLRPSGILKTIWSTSSYKTLSVELKRSYKKVHRIKLTGQLLPSEEEWVLISDLICAAPNKGMRTGIRTIFSQQNKYRLHYSTSFLLGYYVAEGSCGGDGSQISFAGHQREDSVMSILNTAISRLRHRKNFRGLKKYDSKTDKGRRLIFGNSNLWRKFKKLGTFENKHFPWWICHVDSETALYLICGYLFGDGHFSKTGIAVNSVSRNIIYQLFILFSKVDIKPALYFCQRQGRYKGLGKSKMTKNDTYNLSLDLISTSKILTFIEKNLKTTFCSKLVHSFQMQNTSNGWRNKYSFLREISIMEFSGFVYEIEVENGSYNVNAIFIKNS